MRSVKIAIIGSGSTYTPELIEGLINRREELPLRALYLVDIDARKRQIVGDLCERMLRVKGITCPVVQTDAWDEALDGADFVLAQIRVGKLPARILDEKIPLKHRMIGQETCGIGGMFKG
ncbi:MAG: 6-phospho-beta-glucosidase, partial [Clostridia bacterium]|nr:6-phospho-beta-glucosidase [Clostridia bacterium]